MDNNGWLDMSTCPTAESADKARRIIVWHVFQGAMVYNAFQARENRFCVYWREPPEKWIDPHDRLPTVEDADPQSCILVIDKYGEMRMRGWHQVQTPEDVQGWTPRPEPPDNYKELRATAG